MDYFDPHLYGNISIVVVGLGGTGSILARHVCRTVYDMRRRGLQTPQSICFVDPDIVEAKNVGRQMFTPADVGQYKAELLAKRFNYALGLNIVWHNEPFDSERHTDKYGNKTVILGAVDNHLARQAIAKAKGVWIDAGNHFDSGQVVIGNTDNPSLVERWADGEWRHLPNASLVFPELLEADDDPQPDVSCADLVEMGEQHLLVNDMMATIAGQYIYKLLYRQPVHTFMTFVDCNTLTMRSVPIAKENIADYMKLQSVRHTQLD